MRTYIYNMKLHLMMKLVHNTQHIENIKVQIEKGSYEKIHVSIGIERGGVDGIESCVSGGCVKRKCMVIKSCSGMRGRRINSVETG